MHIILHQPRILLIYHGTDSKKKKKIPDLKYIKKHIKIYIFKNDQLYLFLPKTVLFKPIEDSLFYLLCTLFIMKHCHKQEIHDSIINLMGYN